LPPIAVTVPRRVAPSSPAINGAANTSRQSNSDVMRVGEYFVRIMSFQGH